MTPIYSDDLPDDAPDDNPRDDRTYSCPSCGYLLHDAGVRIVCCPECGEDADLAHLGDVERRVHFPDAAGVRRRAVRSAAVGTTLALLSFAWFVFASLNGSLPITIVAVLGMGFGLTLPTVIAARSPHQQVSIAFFATLIAGVWTAVAGSAIAIAGLMIALALGALRPSNAMLVLLPLLVPVLLSPVYVLFNPVLEGCCARAGIEGGVGSGMGEGNGKGKGLGNGKGKGEGLGHGNG